MSIERTMRRQAQNTRDKQLAKYTYLLYRQAETKARREPLSYRRWLEWERKLAAQTVTEPVAPLSKATFSEPVAPFSEGTLTE